MNIIIFLLLYIQFFAIYILQTDVPVVTVLITALIFINIYRSICFTYDRVDKLIFIYMLCLCLGFINRAFIICANIIGYVIYMRHNNKISVRNIAGYCIILNAIFILACTFMIATDPTLIRVWGYKFDREIVLYAFHNPNSKALFLFLCSLSLWLFIRNKIFRIGILVVMTFLIYWLTYGRTFTFANIGLLLADFYNKKSRMKYFSFFLVLTPIIVSIFSFVIAIIARNVTIIIYDEGIHGRFWVYGHLLGNMSFFNILFGINEEITVPLDGSFFAIFATMGIFMFMYLLIIYCKAIININKNIIKYIPAIIAIILAGITESALALFSINTVFLVMLLVISGKERETT